jgi:hypothetical protein
MDAQTIIQNRQVNLALDRLINCSDFTFLQRFVMDGITLQNLDYNEREKEDINALFSVLNELSRHSVRHKDLS